MFTNNHRPSALGLSIGGCWAQSQMEDIGPGSPLAIVYGEMDMSSMDRTRDERSETLDPRDDPPQPGPQIETDVEVGGGDVLIPDDDDQVDPDDTVQRRRPDSDANPR